MFWTVAPFNPLPEPSIDVADHETAGPDVARAMPIKTLVDLPPPRPERVVVEAHLDVRRRRKSGFLDGRPGLAVLEREDVRPIRPAVDAVVNLAELRIVRILTIEKSELNRRTGLADSREIHRWSNQVRDGRDQDAIAVAVDDRVRTRAPRLVPVEQSAGVPSRLHGPGWAAIGLLFSTDQPGGMTPPLNSSKRPFAVKVYPGALQASRFASSVQLWTRNGASPSGTPSGSGPPPGS